MLRVAAPSFTINAVSDSLQEDDEARAPRYPAVGTPALHPVSGETPMRYWICDGHGSVEENTAYSPITVPRGVTVVIYAPPGAALADDLGRYLHDKIRWGHARDVHTFVATER